MKNFLKLFSFVFIFFVQIAAAENFTAGKEYQIIEKNNEITSVTPSNKILVEEFFSYGCPWCFH